MAKKRGRPKKTNEEKMMDMMESVVTEVKSIADRVKDLEEKPPIVSVKTGELPSDIQPGLTFPGNPMPPSTTTSSAPTPAPILNTVPVDFVKAKNEILGEDFEIKVVAVSNLPSFWLHVIVPKDKSSLKENELQVPDEYMDLPIEERIKYKQDRRSKMISNAAGLNGVKDWMTLIRKNLMKTHEAEGRPFAFN